jgi:hypothetical protein
VLRELYPLQAPRGGELSSHACRCEDDEWWRRFEAEFRRELVADPGGTSLSPMPERTRPGRERTIVRGAGSATVAIAELVSSGAGVLTVCADASRRAALASGATGLARFNGGAGRIACFRCGAAALEGVLGRAAGGLALTDYAALERAPAALPGGFEHIVLIDPPPSASAWAGATAPRSGGEVPGAGPGFVHPLWTEAEGELSLAVLDRQLASRESVAAVFRRLREAGEATAGELRSALAGPGPHPLCPESAARCLRVLSELGLVAGEPSAGAGNLGVVSSEGTDLERSAAFRAYRAEHSEAQRYLARPKEQ